ncbi:BTAD domain-containing putative transcriptional regulator [Nonomuraea sp. B10E15]|uniref:BTAD domain-containing putative transcriptional regulator n=1 Tax=Nonomuraea sp. B10E15 TaxID=3153560 RepID=UPI00325D1AF8
MRIEVLGPVRLSTDEGIAVEVAERHLRLLLASVVAADGRPVPADAMIDRLWDGDLPADPKKVLQAKLSRLRATLDRARPGARELLTHTPAGYRLAMEPDALDAGLFKSNVERARRMSSSPEKAASLVETLALWRGDPFGDVTEEVWLAPAVAELHGVRGDAVEALVETLLEQGDPQQALSQASGAVEDYATREGLVSSVMTALYQVGRQHEALEIFERLRRRLSEELGVDPTPRIRELHSHILRQDPILASSSAARPAQHSLTGHSNIPAETGPLIGRREESEQIKALLARSRLVTLNGIGGVGKTRLALHVAREQASDFERGTWFADLTELTATPEDQLGSGERIASLMAMTIGLPEHDTTTNTLDRLSEALGPRPVLLVLDNCEHVIAEAAVFTTDLLRQARGVRVLATSREPLGLPEEQRYHVSTLTTEPSEGDGRSEAVSFFLTRAQSSDPAFRLDDGDVDAVEQLCRRLDGLPLALELAAARIRGLSVTDLLERLSDRLSILRRPGHAAPRRQQTLRGMIDWSWSLLDDTERAVLRRLAVHPGSMGLEAAEAICSDEPDDPGTTAVERAEVIDVLIGLVDRSLVTTTSTPAGVRYGLLESIAAYAGEKLDSSAERQATARRHLRYYGDFACEADDGLRTRQQRHWLARFSAERAQMRHAFDEAVRTGDGRSATALTLATFWHQVCVPGFSISPWIDGYHTRLGRDLQTVLNLPGVGGDDYAAAATLAACMSADTEEGARHIEEALHGFGAETVTKARVQWFAGASLLSAGLREAGERHVDQALASLAGHGEDWDLAVAACRRDWLIVTLWREAPRGLPDGREVSEVLREVDDGYGSMYALAVEHRFAELVGDHRRSAAAVTAALAMSRELGIESETSLWLTGSAIAALRDGNLDDAVKDLTDSRAISAEIGFANGLAYADFAEAMIARHRGDLTGARTLLDRWRGFTQAANAELLTEFEQGFLAAQEHDLAAAIAAFETFVSLTPQRGDTRTTARMLELAAAIRMLAADPRAAADSLGAAEAIRTRAGAEPSVPERRDIRQVSERIAETLSDREFSAAMARGGAHDPVDHLQAVASSKAVMPRHDDGGRQARGPGRARRSR